MQLIDIANRLFKGEIDEKQAAVELDAMSAEMKRRSAFGVEPQGPGKHQASKPGFLHSMGVKKVARKKRVGDGLTNHERVVAGRAKRMGLSIEEYRRMFNVK